MKLIVGLGNPGKQYEKVRHNLGFMVLDGMVGKDKWEEESKFQSEVLKLSQDVWLVKPQTYMNNSGVAVLKMVDYFKLTPEEVIIVHDDLDLMLGKVKVRQGGAAGGHHGVESIISALGSDQFIRVRLGIGPSTGSGQAMLGEHRKAHFNAEHFVLEPFMPNEKSKVKHMVKQAEGALEILLDKGLDVAQNQFN